MSETSTPANDLRTQGNALHKAIDFGFQVEAFLESEIGQYLISRAEAQIDEAVDKLKHVDPADPNKVRALQHLVHVAEAVQYWLADAITAGYNAQDELLNQAQAN